MSATLTELDVDLATDGPPRCTALIGLRAVDAVRCPSPAVWEPCRAPLGLLSVIPIGGGL